MSTNSYNAGLDYMPTAVEKPSLFARVREYMSALHDGLEAWREYERLRTSGVEHNLAASKAFEKHFEK